MLTELREKLHAEVGKVVVGHGRAVDALLAAVTVGGHVLIEGVPGTAKTLLARTFARALGLVFSRAQFTPDMLPSDLTGTMTLRGGELVFRNGPVFTNILLADEINRTPPKTQAALLEAMAESQVTVDGTSHPLPTPFMTIATQNPIEYEGTYPLPEAQLDRFLMKIEMGYPEEDAERSMLHMERSGTDPTTFSSVNQVTSVADLAHARGIVDATTITAEVADYVLGVIRQTRVQPAVELGASPRAAVHLLASSKARAQLAGRTYVTPDDVALMAPLVLRHRILLRPEAELDRYRPDDAIAAAVASTPVPR